MSFAVTIFMFYASANYPHRPDTPLAFFIGVVTAINGAYLFIARPGAPALTIFRLWSLWLQAKEKDLEDRVKRKS
jgi:hypothetical protein